MSESLAYRLPTYELGVLGWLWRGWRVVGTAISFTVFGLGGLLLWVLFSLSALVIHDPRRRRAFCRRTLHYAFRFFVGLMRSVGVIRWTLHDRERLLRGGLVVLANHPTLIDVVFLISFIPEATCVVKAALARNPFTRGPVTAAGFIFNDSGPGLIDDCIRAVKAGETLILFPEGTRSPTTGPLKMQRGAANIVVRGGLDITPVTIQVDPPLLNKKLTWWRVPPKRAVFDIRVREDISVAPWLKEAGDGNESKAARAVTQMLHSYFSPVNPRNADA